MQIAACLGGTLWLLDAPDRIWPWFTVVFAALGAIGLVFLTYEERGAALAQAIAGLLLVGGAFYYAGGKFLALEYDALRWLCWGIAGAHALNAVVAVVVAAAGAGKKG